MGLGLVGIGMGLGLLCALATLLSGGGWLWAMAVYALTGCAGVFTGAGLMLWRGRDETTRQIPRRSQPSHHTGHTSGHPSRPQT